MWVTGTFPSVSDGVVMFWNLTTTIDVSGATLCFFWHLCVKSPKAGTCLSVYNHICEKYDTRRLLIKAVRDICFHISRQKPMLCCSLSSGTLTLRALLFPFRKFLRENSFLPKRILPWEHLRSQHAAWICSGRGGSGVASRGRQTSQSRQSQRVS